MYYVHMGPLGTPCLNSPVLTVLPCIHRITAATHVHEASSRSHAIFTIHYAQVGCSTDFYLMPRGYFLVFLSFFPPAFMLTCSLIQLTSSLSSAYLLLITVQNMSTLISQLWVCLKLKSRLKWKWALKWKKHKFTSNMMEKTEKFSF